MGLFWSMIDWLYLYKEYARTSLNDICCILGVIFLSKEYILIYTLCETILCNIKVEIICCILRNCLLRLLLSLTLISCLYNSEFSTCKFTWICTFDLYVLDHLHTDFHFKAEFWFVYVAWYRIPIAAGKDLDLHRLFVEVTPVVLLWRYHDLSLFLPSYQRFLLWIYLIYKVSVNLKFYFLGLMLMVWDL